MCVVYIVKILLLVSAAYFNHFLHLFMCKDYLSKIRILKLLSYFSATCNEVFSYSSYSKRLILFMEVFCVELSAIYLLKLCVLISELKCK